MKTSKHQWDRIGWGDLLRSWRYQPDSARDPRVDLLRGLCVFAMIMVHISGAFQLRILQIAAKYILAAEAFVLLAGMLGGLSGLACIKQGRFPSVVQRNLMRALRMYGLLIALTVIFAALGVVSGLEWAAPIVQMSLGEFIWKLLTLRIPFWMIEILLLYTILLAVTPFFLWLLKRGLWWVLCAGSWGLWLGFQLSPKASFLAWPMPLNYNETFYPAAWQIYYVHGLLLGYHLAQIRSWLNPRRISLLGSLAAALAALVGALFLADLLHIVTPVADGSSSFFGKFSVRPGRLLLALATFPGVWVLTTRCWQPLHRATGWLFVPLGQHALVAYVMHLPLIFAFNLLVFRLPGFFGHLWVNRLVPLVAPLLVWLLLVMVSRLLQRVPMAGQLQTPPVES